MLSIEQAKEQALATNLNKVVMDALKLIGKHSVEIVQLAPDSPDGEEILKHLNTIIEATVKSLDCVRIVMAHYNKELGEFSDADPDNIRKVKEWIDQNDQIQGMDMQLRLNAEDRLLQYRMRGH